MPKKRKVAVRHSSGTSRSPACPAWPATLLGRDALGLGPQEAHLILQQRRLLKVTQSQFPRARLIFLFLKLTACRFLMMKSKLM